MPVQADGRKEVVYVDVGAVVISIELLELLVLVVVVDVVVVVCVGVTVTVAVGGARVTVSVTVATQDVGSPGARCRNPSSEGDSCASAAL